jgi:hypothetical protein
MAYHRSAEASFLGEHDMMKLFLLFAGVFLLPVALTYGVDPAATLPKFMNMTVEGTDLTHIFRALGCLYLGMVTFCIIAAFTPEWRHVAVIWAVFFAYSLAIGRIISMVVDGMPSGMLLFFLMVELIVGTVGLLLLARERRKAETRQ